ncbi:uncharacterized protein LOC109598173 [Aethina tumida]|uniref:uncharacterized protein LOC109598173 n=1 Tax=Aethina tumida TaxID=116153 RepID=UPI0021482E70|nr:uncharacterized protein LOC109598173 [Aethina tumida]
MLISGYNFLGPVPQSINLDDSNDFEVMDTIPDEEMKDVYDEEEMVKLNDKLEEKSKNLGAYYRIHQIAKRRNEGKKVTIDEQSAQLEKFESNPDMEEPIPWKARLTDLDSELHRSRNKLHRRSENASDVNLDYAELEREYKAQLRKKAHSNNTVNATEIKEDESLKDALGTLVDFKKSKNCTDEERKGIGFKSIMCYINEPENQDNRLSTKIFYLSLVILAAYIIIAIPCWCSKGWCCCCCRCKWCFPRQRIDEAKKFLADNPVGVYHDKDGKKIEFKTTIYEKYAFAQLEKALKKC